MLSCRNAFFFFFQAEDGIRDHCVTGVQTCALPISVTGTPVARTLAWRSTEATVTPPSRRSEERREGKSVDLGGRRIIKKKKNNEIKKNTYNKAISPLRKYHGEAEIH